MPERVLGVLRFTSPSNHEFPTAKEEDDDVGVVKPIDEAGELFGSRSVTMTVQTWTETTAAGARRVELEVTANDQPWTTYTATIRGEDGQTVVDVEYRSNRQFGLRRLPQQHYAERYRNETLTAQGYAVVERDSQFSF